MKAIVLIFLVASTYLSLANTIELKQAIKSGKITVQRSYITLGVEGMELTITNTLNQTLSIKVEGGTMFIPENEDEQSLLNVEDELIVLRGKEKKSVLVGAYCIDYNKLAPSLTSDFKIDKIKEPVLLSLLDFIKNNKLGEDNYQSGIWALTNNKPISYITNDTPEGIKLREFIAEKTNRDNPWYKSNHDTTAEPGEQIQRSSTSVEGDLNVKFNENTNFEFAVIDKSNNVEKRSYPGGAFRKNYETSFRFKLKVSGWKSGKYEVVLRKISDQSTIATFPFEV